MYHLVYLEHRKTLPCRGFILKPIGRPCVPLKNGTKHFSNSPLFKRSACFYVTISTDFERYQ